MWSLEERNKTKRIESIFSDRKLVAEEHDRLGEDLFVEKYSADSITLRKLKHLIRDARN